MHFVQENAQETVADMDFVHQEAAVNVKVAILGLTAQLVKIWRFNIEMLFFCLITAWLSFMVYDIRDSESKLNS